MPYFSLMACLDIFQAQLLHGTCEVSEKRLVVGGVQLHERLRSGIGDQHVVRPEKP